MNKVDISIVVCGYKSENTITPFLNSIKRSKDTLNKEIIVVDNYPFDKGAEMAQKHSLKPVVIRNKENVGFSKAINRGIKEAKGKYILIINPDTEIKGNALKLLFDFAEKHPVLGAVAPKLLNNDGKTQPSVFMFPTILNAIKHDFFGCKQCFKKYFPGNKTTKVQAVVMAAFLVPRTTINLVGGLDERFFLYFEDIEFCRRLKKYNLPIFFFPKARVVHAHGASGNFSDHLNSPLLASAKLYYGSFYLTVLNTVLWIGHKWQVILRGKRFRD